jgi:hypothetical protein
MPNDRTPDEWIASAAQSVRDGAASSNIDVTRNHFQLAQIYATLALQARTEDLVEEQRLANKIAAYQAELIVNPHGVGTREHDQWWIDFGGPITQAVTS